MMNNINNFINKFHLEEAGQFNILKQLPDESIDCVITSPPYYALRDYGVDGQIGLESSFQVYINNLLDLFDEVKRVLKPTGACWVNIGDTYSTKSGSGFINNNLQNKSKEDIEITTGINKANELRGSKNLNYPDKCLIQIPERFSIGMTDRGWIKRNTIIWYKRNCMPTSIKDRFTVDFEYLYFFVKNKKYYFKQQLEKAIVGYKGIDFIPNSKKDKESISLTCATGASWNNRTDELQMIRNKRCVWQINTKPYKEAHFAVFPSELIESPLDATCPEFVCKKCGKPKEKIYKSNIDLNGLDIKNISKEDKLNIGSGGENFKRDYIRNAEYRKRLSSKTVDTIESSCSCNAGFTSGIVLDPFMGSGTTALVAIKQNKKFIGLDINEEYIKLAEKRIKPYLLNDTLF